MKTIRKISVIIFGLLILVWPITGFSLEVGDVMPDFVVETLGGETISSSEIKGRHPVMLVFWATWCPNCKREIPHINELLSEFGSQGMRFLGINVGVNDSAKKAARYVKKYKVKYPIVFDEGSKVTRSFGVQGTPTIIIADREGIVRYHGFNVPDDMDSHFEQLTK